MPPDAIAALVGVLAECGLLRDNEAKKNWKSIAKVPMFSQADTCVDMLRAREANGGLPGQCAGRPDLARLRQTAIAVRKVHSAQKVINDPELSQRLALAGEAGIEDDDEFPETAEEENDGLGVEGMDVDQADANVVSESDVNRDDDDGDAEMAYYDGGEWVEC